MDKSFSITARYFVIAAAQLDPEGKLEAAAEVNVGATGAGGVALQVAKSTLAQQYSNPLTLRILITPSNP